MLSFRSELFLKIPILSFEDLYLFVFLYNTLAVILEELFEFQMDLGQLIRWVLIFGRKDLAIGIFFIWFRGL